MNREQEWSAVDDYFAERLLPPDSALDASLEASNAAGLPEISVSPLQGAFLGILVRALGARRVLEVGTLGAYSAICMARALAPGGRLLTLEYDRKHVEVARKNIERAGLEDVIEVRAGRALDLLPKIAEAGEGPFDLVFIDADKGSNADYFDWALKLTRPGSLIIVDNVVRAGGVADPKSRDASVVGVRRLMDRIAGESRVSATAIQTVGHKGHDGLMFAVVL